MHRRMSPPRPPATTPRVPRPAQDPRLPLGRRMSLALGFAGPSISLAAACEGLAFGLGALTPMPAVRNFSLCACAAVLLDFVLQVRAVMPCAEGSDVAKRAAVSYVIMLLYAQVPCLCCWMFGI